MLHFPGGSLAAEPTVALPLSFQLMLSLIHDSLYLSLYTHMQTISVQRRENSYNPWTKKKINNKSANWTTAAVARFLSKPSLIARIGFLPKLLAAAVEGLNVVFTKELLKPQAACLHQQVFIFCAHTRLCVHTPSSLGFKQMNPTRPSYLPRARSIGSCTPLPAAALPHPFAENWLAVPKRIRIRTVIFSVNTSKCMLTWSQILEQARQLAALMPQQAAGGSGGSQAARQY